MVSEFEENLVEGFKDCNENQKSKVTIQNDKKELLDSLLAVGSFNLISELRTLN